MSMRVSKTSLAVRRNFGSWRRDAAKSKLFINGNCTVGGGKLITPHAVSQRCNPAFFFLPLDLPSVLPILLSLDPSRSLLWGHNNGREGKGREGKRKRKVSLRLCRRRRTRRDGDGRGKEVSPICRCLIVKTDEQKLGSIGEMDDMNTEEG